MTWVLDSKLKQTMPNLIETEAYPRFRPKKRFRGRWVAFWR